jgi:hypothetical protein
VRRAGERPGVEPRRRTVAGGAMNIEGDTVGIGAEQARSFLAPSIEALTERFYPRFGLRNGGVRAGFGRREEEHC